MLILMLIAVVIFAIVAIRGYKEWKKKKGKEYIKEFVGDIIKTDICVLETGLK